MDLREPEIPAGAPAGDADLALLDALRRGEEAAFVTLVDRYHSALVRLARVHVGSAAVAEEVVQETWLGVLQGLARFQGRASLKTWIFHILMNRARTRAVQEGRTIPFSALVGDELEHDEPSVDPSRFRKAGDRWPDHWATAPRSWAASPEDLLLQGEVRACIDEAVAALPVAQRSVITLRDIEGFASDEVCSVLSLSEANQRVLLHRARARVRRALEAYFDRG